MTHEMPPRILLLVLLFLHELISKTLYRGQRAPHPLEWNDTSGKTTYHIMENVIRNTSGTSYTSSSISEISIGVDHITSKVI